MATPEGNALPGNYGRWGPDDDRGTLNLITDEVRARAVTEARSGRTVSLAHAIKPTPLIAGPTPIFGGSAAVQQAMMFTGSPSMAMAELLVITTHHPQLTHIDALTHTVVDGMVYPGVPLSERGNAAGISRGSSSIFAGGVLTRGVLIDLAEDGPLPVDYGVTGADLDGALARTGTEFLPGDALVVHGGWDLSKDTGGTFPGMTLDAVAWMHRHDVSVYLGDIRDVRPSHNPGIRSPLHHVGIVRMGMPLVDSADPTELVRVCREEGRNSFMLVLAPQRLEGATGLPINPMAIF
ncbi:cyclase family protein [Pseudarthrobacter raffinosi]|uniref:cyclase family protein n=1 Tax=Pseudarthrobacter raffinosi TaxID=2953651 RepID=UPI00208F9707|nr:cyclase family protein [Pseudarthrobacter sp. MDT3-9]MCO4252131.1 cyclase family protein [Pseudarthrobacter sp. MDT3-9]